MTRYILILLLFTAPFPGLAQKSISDSLQYYQKQLIRLQQHSDTVLHASEPFMSTEQRLRRLQAVSKGYTAFMIFGEADGANFNAFNKGIALDEFPGVKGPVFRGGLGFSFKANGGFMLDWSLGAFGFNKKSVNGGETIKVSYSDALMVDVGYAIINHRVFDLYPYAGLSMRSATLDFKAPVTTNAGYSSVASLIQNDRSFDGSTLSLGYQAGIALDVMVAHNQKGLSGTILFCKFGTDGAFGPGLYHSNGINYNANIQYGAWAASLGVKFFGKD